MLKQRWIETARLMSVLQGREPQRLSLPGFRESAVLVPLLVSGDPVKGNLAVLEDPQVLFIVRTDTLPTHAGQVAFPGGKKEPQDQSLEHTALRESYEELAIPHDRVKVFGALDDIPTPFQFTITPFVGLLNADVPLVPDPGEVAETFTMPLFDLPSLYREGPPIEWRGRRYKMHDFAHPKHRIWGATAVMLLQLLFLLGLSDIDGSRHETVP